jgi:hypothetical protein
VRSRSSGVGACMSTDGDLGLVITENKDLKVNVGITDARRRWTATAAKHS